MHKTNVKVSLRSAASSAVPEQKVNNNKVKRKPIRQKI